eukprot:1738993-Pyramimonas_sp.AAC.1
MDLPSIAGSDVMAVAVTFPKKTALGWGGFRPRLLLLGQPFADRVVELLAAWGRDPRPSDLFATLI